ncbi:uncharacterized protein LOC113177228 [Urocitellus parryii]
MEVKNSWDADGMQSKDYWAQVQGELCGRLRRYLVFWKDSSYSSGASAQRTLLSPVVNVTCAEALEDTINVTCWAFGFYPQNISVTWLQDGEPLSQDAQQSGGIFFYENGTYQTWVSTRIPQGLEQGFSCHVGHSGNNSTGLVSCGTALLFKSQWAAILGVAAAAVAVIMIIVCVCSCKKRKTKCTSEGSDPSKGVSPVGDLDCDHDNAKEQKMGLQFTLQNLRKTLVFFGKKTSEDCEDCGLQKSLLGMEEGSPGKPQEKEAHGEELGSQQQVIHAEPLSLYNLDQQQRAPSDYTGFTQLGCQPLLRAPGATGGSLHWAALL